MALIEPQSIDLVLINCLSQVLQEFLANQNLSLCKLRRIETQYFPNIFNRLNYFGALENMIESHIILGKLNPF